MYYLLVFIACFFTSSSALFVKFSTVPSVVLVLYRLILTCLILLPMLIKNSVSIKHINKNTFLLIILSGLSFGLHLITFFEALKFTGIAETTIIVSTELLFVAAYEIIILKHKIKPLSIALLVISMFGLVLILSEKGFSSGKLVVCGNVLALLAAIFSASYTVLGKHARKNVDTHIYTFLIYSIAALECLIFAIFTKQNIFDIDLKNLGLAIGLAIFPTMLGHNIYSLCLKHLKASFISAVKLIMPVFSTLLAFFILGQKPERFVIIGSIIMILAMLWYTYLSSKEPAQ